VVAECGVRRRGHRRSGSFPPARDAAPIPARVAGCGIASSGERYCGDCIVTLFSSADAARHHGRPPPESLGPGCGACSFYYADARADIEYCICSQPAVAAGKRRFGARQLSRDCSGSSLGQGHPFRRRRVDSLFAPAFVSPARRLSKSTGWRSIILGSRVFSTTLKSRWRN
jgi:hypothetical protein